MRNFPGLQTLPGLRGIAARLPRPGRLPRVAPPAWVAGAAGRAAAGAKTVRLRPRSRRTQVALVVVLALVGGSVVALWPRQSMVRVTAYFPRTVGLYQGSDVRVLGVRVGEVTRIAPQGDRVRVELSYEAHRKVPAGAKAAIVNSSVVSDRYLQLLPVYRGGPVMEDGDVIPQRRTAVPVELDRVFDSLHTTSEALGPEGANADGALSRLLGVSADNLEGQGRQLHQTVEDLAEAVDTLSGGRKDMFGTVRNLQVFTAALAANDKGVREFNDSLAEVAGQLSAERGDLAKALKHLSRAMQDVAAFVRGNKESLSRNVEDLSEVTRVLVDQRAALEEFMDVVPAGLGNLARVYNPASGTLDTRNNAQQPQDPGAQLCSLLKTAGEVRDCSRLKKVFDELPDPPKADELLEDGRSLPRPPTTDRTLGGILGASA